MVDIIIKQENGCNIVNMSGSIYVDDAAGIRQELIDEIEAGRTNIVIDFKEVNYIDSSGLGVLISIHKRALQHGGQVRVRNLHGVVKELFELTRLTRVFEVI